LPFFLPGRLADLQYLGGEDDDGFAQAVKGHEYDHDFAFFVVNFGWSIDDYEKITLKQKTLIIRAWEDRLVADSNMLASAVTVGTANANLKRGKSPLKLWRKRPKIADNDQARLDVDQILQAERLKGKSWVQKIRGGK